MASKYRKKFALPEEFYPILEAYTREVLRDQPVDILEFSYLYFKNLEEGTLDQFDYPKKGENIPPSKHGRPAQQTQQQMQQQDQQEDYDQEVNNEYGQEAQNQNQEYYEEEGQVDEDNAPDYGQEEYDQQQADNEL